MLPRSVYLSVGPLVGWSTDIVLIHLGGLSHYITMAIVKRLAMSNDTHTWSLDVPFKNIRNLSLG